MTEASTPLSRVELPEPIEEPSAELPESEDTFPTFSPPDGILMLASSCNNACTDKYKSLMAQAMDEAALLSFLTHSRWPQGFQREYVSTRQDFALRIVLVDNTGSNLSGEGHKVIGKGAKARLVPCSPWAEMVDFLSFEARLAEAGKIPTEFRFLAQEKSTIVGLRNDGGYGLQETLALLSEQPRGTGSISQQIRDLYSIINALEPNLVGSGKKICVTLATDGHDPDGDIFGALQPLQHMPVWMVLMLTNKNPEVVEFWSSIDSQIELTIDVVSDIVTESRQVQSFNPWLTYGIPLHQLRLLGAGDRIREVDYIDERPLSLQQMEKIIRLIVPEEMHHRISASATDNLPVFVDAVEAFYLSIAQSSQQTSTSASPAITPKQAPKSTFPEESAALASPSPRLILPNKIPRTSSHSSAKDSSPRDGHLALYAFDPIAQVTKPWVDVTQLATSFALVRTPKSSSCAIS